MPPKAPKKPQPVTKSKTATNVTASVPSMMSCKTVSGCVRKESQSSSSSSVSTRSSTATNKDVRKARLAEKQALEATATVNSTRRRIDDGAPSAKAVPPHLVSHLLPYCYPDSDCTLNNGEVAAADRTNTVAADEDHRTGTSKIKQVRNARLAEQRKISKAEVREKKVPKKKPLPPHLVSHLLPYFYPSELADQDGTETPRPSPSDSAANSFSDEPTFWSESLASTQETEESPSPDQQPTKRKRGKGRSNLDTQQRRSDIFNRNDLDADGKNLRTSIRCAMTAEHANTRDSLFPSYCDSVVDDDDNNHDVELNGNDNDRDNENVALNECDSVGPMMSYSGRRRRVGNRDLFEESPPEQRPTCIVIVPRSPEDTKENLFGSETPLPRPRRHWQNDTKQTIFGSDSVDETQTPQRRRRDEDTKDKLFGPTWGIKEAHEEYLRRRRPVRENTQETLFGDPIVPTAQRPQLVRSHTSTHENLFGDLPSSQFLKRPLLRRENTFDNLFGSTPTRHSTASESAERYTPSSPKLLKDSLTQVLSFADPRHGPPPPERRFRKAVYPTEAFNRCAETVLSPITHDELPASRARSSAPCDAHWAPLETCNRRRQLSVWDTVNTITGEPLPYELSNERSESRAAWVAGTIQSMVAPPSVASASLASSPSMSVASSSPRQMASQCEL